MKAPPKREPVTPEQWIGVVSAVVIILVPMILIVGFSENRVIHLLFGDGRILAWWVIFTVVALAYRQKIDRYVANELAKRGRKRK